MDTNKVAPRIMSGFMELSPQKQIAFNKMVDTVRETYESFGFAPLDTPVLELSEVLLAKAGGETEKQIYRFVKGDTDMALRFDLTVPLARFVAMHAGELPFPFKRYQIAKVYRGERAQKGRFREFYQADIDVIGLDELDISYDAEMPAVIYQVFKKLGLPHFTILISNRKLLKGFMEHLGLAELAPDVLRVVDKIAKIGKDKVAKGLAELGLTAEQVAQVLQFTAISDSNDEVLAGLKATKAFAASALFAQGVAELEQVVASLSALGVDKDSFALNLAITRGLDYYTGTIYETVLDDYPELGSICSGGRYDDLAGFYTEKKLPGVGISIGLTRLFYKLDELGLLTLGATVPAEVMVVPITENEVAAALAFGAALRAQGVKVLSFTEAGKKFKTKLNYANRLAVPFVAIIGEDEAKRGIATVKNMQTGEQGTMDAEGVRAMLNKA